MKNSEEWTTWAYIWFHGIHGWPQHLIPRSWEDDRWTDKIMQNEFAYYLQVVDAKHLLPKPMYTISKETKVNVRCRLWEKATKIKLTPTQRKNVYYEISDMWHEPFDPLVMRVAREITPLVMRVACEITPLEKPTPQKVEMEIAIHKGNLTKTGFSIVRPWINKNEKIRGVINRALNFLGTDPSSQEIEEWIEEGTAGTEEFKRDLHTSVLDLYKVLWAHSRTIAHEHTDIEKLIHQWIQEVPVSSRHYPQFLRRFYAEHKDSLDFPTDQIQEWINKMDIAPNTNTTYKGYLLGPNGFFTWATKRGIDLNRYDRPITQNPKEEEEFRVKELSKEWFGDILGWHERLLPKGWREIPQSTMVKFLCYLKHKGQEEFLDFVKTMYPNIEKDADSNQTRNRVAALLWMHKTNTPRTLELQRMICLGLDGKTGHFTPTALKAIQDIYEERKKKDSYYPKLIPKDSNQPLNIEMTQDITDLLDECQSLFPTWGALKHRVIQYLKGEEYARKTPYSDSIKLFVQFLYAKNNTTTKELLKAIPQTVKNYALTDAKGMGMVKAQTNKTTWPIPELTDNLNLLINRFCEVMDKEWRLVVIDYLKGKITDYRRMEVKKFIQFLDAVGKGPALNLYECIPFPHRIHAVRDSAACVVMQEDIKRPSEAMSKCANLFKQPDIVPCVIEYKNTGNMTPCGSDPKEKNPEHVPCGHIRYFINYLALVGPRKELHQFPKGMVAATLSTQLKYERAYIQEVLNKAGMFPPKPKPETCMIPKDGQVIAHALDQALEQGILTPEQVNDPAQALSTLDYKTNGIAYWLLRSNMKNGKTLFKVETTYKIVAGD